MKLNLLLILLLPGSVKGQTFLQSICGVFWVKFLCPDPEAPIREDGNRQPGGYQCTPDPDPTTAVALIESQYDIDLNFRGVPLEDQSLFREAANRWRRVIVGDVADVSQVLNLSPCGFGPSAVDDISICAVYAPIDGRANTVGYAIPTAVRTGADAPLTIVGTMVFDTDDLDYPNFADIIIHEMGHLLGIGPLWYLKPGIMDSAEAGSLCRYRKDTKTSREWNCLTGCDRMPVERDANSRFGSNCLHWDEKCLTSEALTPYIDRLTTGKTPLSKITAAALEDLGYKVSYEGVDPISLADIDPSCLCNNENRRRLGTRSPSTGDWQDETIVPADSPAKAAVKLDAFEFGKRKLREQQEELARTRLNSGGSNGEMSGVEYIGGKWISVMYIDPDTGRPSSVVVTDDDLEPFTIPGEPGD